MTPSVNMLVTITVHVNKFFNVNTKCRLKKASQCDIPRNRPYFSISTDDGKPMNDPNLIQNVQQICDAIRHCRTLGLIAVAAASGKVTLELPYSPSIVGNPETGVIHGGALTTLMDSACGFAVHMSLEKAEICPTLDLRIDYMTAAEPNRSVFGAAEVYRITRHVIFVRGVAYQSSLSEPVAHCVATFMRISEPRFPNLDGAASK